MFEPNADSATCLPCVIHKASPCIVSCLFCRCMHACTCHDVYSPDIITTPSSRDTPPRGLLNPPGSFPAQDLRFESHRLAQAESVPICSHSLSKHACADMLDLPLCLTRAVRISHEAGRLTQLDSLVNLTKNHCMHPLMVPGSQH